MFQSNNAEAKTRVKGRGLGLVFSLALSLFFSLSISLCFAMAGDLPAKFGIRRTCKDITVQGTVRDATTFKPIPNARVELRRFTGEKIATVQTDASGNYRLVKRLASHLYLIKCKFQDQTKQRLRQLIRGKTYTIDFQLRLKKVIVFPTIPVEPAIDSVIPVDYSTFLAGARINIQINATGLNNGFLEYQFSVGGIIKQDWSTSNVYIWQTSASDTGYVGIACKVRDNKGATALKALTYSIINPSVQEILQKVADNYAKIYDFKADMTLSSTLNGQPFGETEYCKYYFKAPNKEKTETYSNPTRSTKIDIIIIDGSTMHLIDPIKNIKQDVDLLADIGVEITQFKQMDLYYNQTLFLNENVVTRNGQGSDLANMIVALDVIPKKTSNIYDKLNIRIDYNKGIITKLLIYRKNNANELELVQETNTVDSEQMPNYAWMPVKMTKTPNLISGKLISSLSYENIKINTGLADIDFNPDKQ